MNENLYIHAQLVKQHRADLTRRAEQERLARMATGMKPARGAAVLAFTGRLLIALGRELQARYGDAMLPEPTSTLAPTHDTSC